MIWLRSSFLVSTLLVGLLCAGQALADGTVMRAKGCGDKVFVSGEKGYSILQVSELGIVGEGDTIVGATDRLGFGSFLIAQSGRHFSASVAQTGLSKAEMTTRIATSCRSASIERQISGQIERAAGCGNKIFLNTPQGYVVLERLAGGLVYPGDTLVGDFTRAGRTTAKDRQTGAELVVFVDDFALSRSAAQHKIGQSCR